MKYFFNNNKIFKSKYILVNIIIIILIKNYFNFKLKIIKTKQTVYLLKLYYFYFIIFKKDIKNLQ